MNPEIRDGFLKTTISVPYLLISCKTGAALIVCVAALMGAALLASTAEGAAGERTPLRHRRSVGARDGGSCGRRADGD